MKLRYSNTITFDENRLFVEKHKTINDWIYVEDFYISQDRKCFNHIRFVAQWSGDRYAVYVWDNMREGQATQIGMEEVLNLESELIFKKIGIFKFT